MKPTTPHWILGRRLLAALLMTALVGATSVQAENGKELDKHAKTNAASVVDKISDRFVAFAGSEDNAEALVAGLRDGGEITLLETSLETPDAGEVETIFTPATSSLGYGEIYIALGLAQASLADLDITEPTSAEVVASLNGGVVTVEGVEVTLDGVLALRAEGYGWGKIAKEHGVKLGPVMKALKKDANALKTKKSKPRK